MPGADPGVTEFARIVGLRSAFVVPLIARDQTIGAMAVMQAQSGRSLDAQDGELITQLAQRAALALDNVRLLAESRRANRSKDVFLAMLGHELRNPLSPIVTSLAVMARRNPDAFIQERQIIERQVRHLSRLVDDLLDVSRIATGKVELHMEILDLEQVLNRSVELAAPAFAGRTPPELHLPSAPLRVTGDRTRLAQVLCNLLVNAAKFSRAGDRVWVEMSGDHDRQQATIAVADEGVGIVADLLPRVFDRFVQGEQGSSRDRGGLGLGLAIARNLVELHGGSITADSAGAGRGSRFVVTLPLCDMHHGENLLPRDASADEIRASRLLVVDDNVDAAQSLGELLEMHGHAVRTASNGLDALKLLQEDSFDVAVLDIGLPQMDGYELATAIRANPALRTIRLVALTGYGQPADRERAFKAGFDAHVVKPIDPERLAEALFPLDDA
jgi:signal transduction histidine kinase/CheY-like chemotaxis protein